MKEGKEEEKVHVSLIGPVKDDLLPDRITVTCRVERTSPDGEDVLVFIARVGRDGVPHVRYDFVTPADLSTIARGHRVLASWNRYLQRLPIPPHSPGDLLAALLAWAKAERVTILTAPDDRTPCECIKDVPAHRARYLLEARLATTKEG
jgi:hypothetical protein